MSADVKSPPGSAADPVVDLATLRVDIDRIDQEMHELLIERSAIIDKLIAIKARQGGGSAFRPGREADMMRRIAMRHRGLLPLDTVEGIWRIIISTFTYVQAPYSVHVDTAAGDAMMRDSARFHFGFTVPFIPHYGALGVIDAVQASQGDLGMVRMDSGAMAQPWWHRLAPPEAPKIIARLPFVERPDHPAGVPAFVLSLPLAEAASRDVVIYEASILRWRDALPELVGRAGGEILGNVGSELGLSILLAMPGNVPLADLKALFVQAGHRDVRLAEIGSHAARHQVHRHPAPAEVSADT
ncbi:MAG TPA: chorismate mutase [Beijerinckiaceae bacterium]|jgi:chorismate mutase|nr:chorismate mutase [Beijerinckiaceae bacterium]